jgi:phage antirepressor YoqD-like protein
MGINIQIFKNSQFGEVRVAEDANGNPLFCLVDVCRILELDTSDVVRRLDEGVVSKHPLLTNGGSLLANFVNEDGMYDAILDSRKPEAKAFRKWITSEVLPSIRKTGGYIVARPDETPEEIMARALIVAQDTINRQKQRAETAESKASLMESVADELHRENETMKPKALFADAVSASDRSCLVSELAKILKQNGVETGQNRLFIWLREHGYLCGKGEYYNQPTQKAMQLDLFKIKETVINKPDGSILVTRTTKVTGKGQLYFVNKFMRELQPQTA